MSWTLLVLAALLGVSSLADGAAVQDDSKSADAKEGARTVFMPEVDADNFFKRRTRRSVRYYEQLAEQKVQRANSERWREYNEDRHKKYENYAEEDRDEQSERRRETNEQFREYHYDGLYPRYHWFH
ncbi:unique cartilage matrix-associated protein-like [Nerophis ophidion]|uniref:unique cartilage matrix-associated protein-like n=1 Tax=Nerophis ophidion TaxID=159077 RepID=UPI002ADF8042|nr:unique cartilage matrix-associated protein-like [Nerophis ophidion]XP_061770606.1 unique cartilage matrix-associated protein-like [Nerophis ophidion]